MLKIRHILVCSFVGLLSFNVSYAYDPGRHQELTGLASKLIPEFRAAPGDSKAKSTDAAALGIIEKVDAAEGERSALIGPLDREYGNVALSTKKEDIDPRRAAERLRYWHFFSAAYYPATHHFDPLRQAPQGTAYSYVADVVIASIQDKINEMVANGTHCKLGMMDIARYGATNRDDLFFEFLGRGVHFIQDATVPAHVVPVYHGPWLPGSGEGLTPGLPIHDPIDSVPIEAGIQNGVVVPPSVSSTTLLHDILRRNIAETLDDLAKPIQAGAFGDLTWEYFFKAPEGKNFFGTYTVIPERRRAFDPTTFEAVIPLSKVGLVVRSVLPFVPNLAVEIPQPLVNAFVRKIHKRAIASTAQYMHSEIKRYFEGKCATKAPVK
ncbi:hypothetical protein EHM76_00635 [bacterium]|nr:MAG: hypothetical protein EHM76_00635 [bacterium]